jgi:hypothetical protein
MLVEWKISGDTIQPTGKSLSLVNFYSKGFDFFELITDKIRDDYVALVFGSQVYLLSLTNLTLRQNPKQIFWSADPESQCSTPVLYNGSFAYVHSLSSLYLNNLFDTNAEISVVLSTVAPTTTTALTSTTAAPTNAPTTSAPSTVDKTTTVAPGSNISGKNNAKSGAVKNAAIGGLVILAALAGVLFA